MPRSSPAVGIAAPALAIGALVVLAASAVVLPAAVAASESPTGPAAEGPPSGPDSLDRAAADPEPVRSTGAHGNHLSADAQISSDGTVVVETLFTLRPGFVVLWTTDDGGGRDEPVGHTSLPGGQFRTDVPVNVTASVWEEWSGNRTLRAVLHRDDGDGEFDVETDRALTLRNPAASVRLALGAGDGDDRVLADHVDPQPVTDGVVTVRRVELSEPGFVAAETRDGDAVVGSTRLPAGRHENVTVALNESFLADRPDRFRVRAVVYRDDGDGVFDASDPRVTVGDEPVGTAFTVRTDGDPGDGSIINTPGGTAIPSVTPPATASSTRTGPPTTTARGTPSVTATDGSGGLGHGFGVGPVVAALLAATLAGLRRR